MRFLKMHGLGNDFVILDHRGSRETLTPELIMHISDRHTGVGCDQLIVIEPSQKADVFMRIYNSDGSEAESCGNATRCVAHLYMREGGERSCTIETRGGVLPCRRLDNGQIEVDMGPPKQLEDMRKGFEGFETSVSVNVGNPHVVFFVEDAEKVPLSQIGPIIENDEAFPDRTNVEFAHINDEGVIRLRVWERGAGITRACGSGACATIAAAVHKRLTGRQARIEMDGGVLSMAWRESDDHILMTGPVAYVFEGKLYE